MFKSVTHLYREIPKISKEIFLKEQKIHFENFKRNFSKRTKDSFRKFQKKFF